ncbi:hypothetical protein GW17_00029778 [Ensete ventricosum]|nr:hypothetical protein GW17_00029778 [Ensete ventricosum]
MQAAATRATDVVTPAGRGRHAAAPTGWPWPQQAAPLEIVYRCIPDPDGEGEGGQVSSLAVSTRWIFAAKLLQFDLTTLAQREGGE